MTALDQTASLSAERLAEIRERLQKVAEGPYEPHWESCDCEYPCGHEPYLYALQLPHPHTVDAEGKPSGYWDFLYSEIGQFTPDTALFFAAAQQDVTDLLAEVDRLSSVMQNAASTAMELGAGAGMDVIIGYLSDAGMLPPELQDGGRS